MAVKPSDLSRTYLAYISIKELCNLRADSNEKALNQPRCFQRGIHVCLPVVGGPSSHDTPPTSDSEHLYIFAIAHMATLAFWGWFTCLSKYRVCGRTRPHWPLRGPVTSFKVWKKLRWFYIIYSFSKGRYKHNREPHYRFTVLHCSTLAWSRLSGADSFWALHVFALKKCWVFNLELSQQFRAVCVSFPARTLTNRCVVGRWRALLKTLLPPNV